MPKIVSYSSRNSRRAGYIALQAGLVVIVGGLAYAAVVNAAQNLAQAHIASGFGFWNNTAGFDISQTLIAYSSSTSTFGRAFWVGLLNTLLVAGIGIVLGRQLCRIDPQRATLVAAFVLVQCRAQIAARIARQRGASRRRFSQ